MYRLIMINQCPDDQAVTKASIMAHFSVAIEVYIYIKSN